MKSFLFLLTLVSLSSFAGTYHGSIVHLDRKENHPTLIYLSDGHVLKITDSDERTLLKNQRVTYHFKTNSRREVLSFYEEEIRPEKGLRSEKSDYAPTVLTSLLEAQNVFKNLRRGARGSSQCYNRAHVWAYESKKNFNLDSMKVFLFFTSKYIREYDYIWWFHVAPFTYVQENGFKTERVLDLSFTKGPTQMKDWTDKFMENKSVCLPVTRYSEYERNQEKAYCYLYRASMYYVQPLDLEYLETDGTEKAAWLNYELKRAYRNGFGVWDF